MAGVDVFRLSFAHGDIPSGIERLRRVRAIAPELAIMVDIPGPKIRAGSFGTSPVPLGVGDDITLVEAFGESSTAERITVERDRVLAQLKVGDRVHIGDGGVSLDGDPNGFSRDRSGHVGGSSHGKAWAVTALFDHGRPASDRR